MSFIKRPLQAPYPPFPILFYTFFSQRYGGTSKKSNFDTRSIHIQILSIQYGWTGGYPATSPLLIGPCSMPPWQQVGGPLNLPGQVQPNITQNCVAQLIVKFVSKKTRRGIQALRPSFACLFYIILLAAGDGATRHHVVDRPIFLYRYDSHHPIYQTIFRLIIRLLSYLL